MPNARTAENIPSFSTRCAVAFWEGCANAVEVLREGCGHGCPAPQPLKSEPDSQPASLALSFSRCLSLSCLSRALSLSNTTVGSPGYLLHPEGTHTGPQYPHVTSHQWYGWFSTFEEFSRAASSSSTVTHFSSAPACRTCPQRYNLSKLCQSQQSLALNQATALAAEEAAAIRET